MKKHDRVEAIEVRKGRKISGLMEAMAKTGFQGKSMATSVEVFEKMITDPNTTILFGYAGSLSTTGQWKIINWFLKNHFIDILVPTGANISEDIVEAMGYAYLQGSATADNEMLFSEGYNRYYDVYGSEKDYLEMTELIAEFILTLESDQKYSSRQFLAQFGKWLKKRKIRSIVTVAVENEIPIFCPAIIDSPYGDAALIAKSKGFDLTLDGIKDYIEFMQLAERVRDTGVVYIGGGVPKDFIQLFAVTGDLLYEDRKIPRRKAQTRKLTDETYYPHKYAVQITTDSPQWGGLSGCTFDEAVSWGKEDPRGKYVQCYCEATIALPIIAHALAERIKTRREGRHLAKFFKD